SATERGGPDTTGSTSSTGSTGSETSEEDLHPTDQHSVPFHPTDQHSVPYFPPEPRRPLTEAGNEATLLERLMEQARKRLKRFR
ncbi:MAG TPA: hypothetical protein VND93_00805, partial [Myxococcales bacterium]|nr:hypothetical protein [Myxococcales bacterium]